MDAISLETGRLLLRPIQAADAPALFAYRSDAETNQYQGWIPTNISEVEAFIDRLPTSFNQPDSWFQLAIIEKENNQLIGDVGIHFLGGNNNQQVELGCTLAKAQHGKGYASETLKCVIASLFHELDKHRMIGSIDPANAGSIALMKRLGFRKEAHFKESLFLDGKWVDDVVYGLLKSEWRH